MSPHDLLMFLSVMPLFLVAIGVIGNLSAFLIFTFNSQMNQMSSMVFLSFIAVADTFSLFVWNLDHFFLTNFAFKLENLGVYSCKFLSFIQFSSLQLSGLLHAFLSIDRYFTIISRPTILKKSILRSFGTPRCALIWSMLLTLFIFALNFHLILFNGHWREELHHPNSSDSYNKMRVHKELVVTIVDFMCFYSKYYEILPMWNRVNMVVYNFAPFTAMLIFNALLIKRTFYTKSRRIANVIHTMRRRRLTKSLLLITFSFIVMTLPSTIIFGFFYDYFYSFTLGEALAMLSDMFMFFQHSSIFFSCFLSNYKFRKIVLEKLAYTRTFFTKFHSDHQNLSASQQKPLIIRQAPVF